jgi:hypothetical protein
MQRLRAAGQPVAEDETVQRVQHQALGAAGGAGDHAHVTRRQAVFAQVSQRARAGKDLQRLHRF